MNKLRKHMKMGSGKAFLLAVCLAFGVGTLSAQTGRTGLSGQQPAVRYDTIRRAVPHSGIFTYPPRTFTPTPAGKGSAISSPSNRGTTVIAVPEGQSVTSVPDRQTVTQVPERSTTTTTTTSVWDQPATMPDYWDSRGDSRAPRTRAPRAQLDRTFALKMNLLYAATATPNLGFEVALGPNISLELSGGYHPWTTTKTTTFEDGTSVEATTKSLEHFSVKPEVRYWLKRPFEGHFFGVHAFYADYNVGGYKIPQLFDKEFFYDGNAFGGGVTYGYHWKWSDRWGMEFNVGFGVAEMDYTKKDCYEDACLEDAGKFKKTYFGPTNAGIKIVFMIK